MSTLKGNRTKEPAYTSYPDFDADFDALCKSTRDAKVKITAEVSDFVGKSATGVSCTLNTYFKFMDSFGTSREETERRYQEAALLFQILPDEEEGQPGGSSAPQPLGSCTCSPPPPHLSELRRGSSPMREAAALKISTSPWRSLKMLQYWVDPLSIFFRTSEINLYVINVSTDLSNTPISFVINS